MPRKQEVKGVQGNATQSGAIQSRPRFEPIEVRSVWGGTQKIYRFNNGYGASVVKHLYSYGGKFGLWELAVIKFDDDGSWEIVYDTPITDDVIGYLKDEDVEKLLEDISNLTPDGKFPKNYTPRFKPKVKG